MDEHHGECNMHTREYVPQLLHTFVIDLIRLLDAEELLESITALSAVPSSISTQETGHLLLHLTLINMARSTCR